MKLAPGPLARLVPVCTALSLGTGLPGHVLAASVVEIVERVEPAEAPATDTAPASTATPAEQASAAELSAQARERFRAKDYDAAVRLFEQAHTVDPSPNYLFNIGRVYEEKRDLKAAVDYYQRFVMEPRVEIGAREQAVQRLRVLKAILNETEPQPPSGSTTGTSTTTGPTPGVPTDRAPAGPADPNKGMRLGGYALLGVGGVGMIIGGVFGGLTLAKRSALDDSMIAEDRRSIAHTGKSFAVIADVGLFAGAALAVTGLALVLVARKRGSSRSAVVPSFGRNHGDLHAGLTWSVRF